MVIFIFFICIRFLFILFIYEIFLRWYRRVFFRSRRFGW